jgi:hypothetical protein
MEQRGANTPCARSVSPASWRRTTSARSTSACTCSLCLSRVSRVNGNKETVFVKGILPQAMQEGHIYIGAWSTLDTPLAAARQSLFYNDRQSRSGESRVKAAGDLRKAHANEELTTVLTTRRLLALCARLERGNEFPRALQVCVLNKVPVEDRKVIEETFQHHVGSNP